MSESLVGFELEIENESFTILLELTKPLESHLKRISRSKLNESALDQPFFKEKIAHRLSLETGIASLQVIAAMKEGSKIKLGEAFSAKFNNSYEEREVKLNINSEKIELQF